MSWRGRKVDHAVGSIVWPGTKRKRSRWARTAIAIWISAIASEAATQTRGPTPKVLWGRRTGTEHGIEFGMEALLRGRELRQQVPAPGHRAQRRLGACGEGQHLVAQFRCAELPAGLAVARSRHAPQQILAAGI